MSHPAISVIMAAYNAEDYLRPAIDSILAQTFSDFELLVINDGSTDRTASIIAEYVDPRVKTIAHKNMGLAKSLNVGLKQATGKYIARMDADDISLPTRLEKQYSYLEKHKDIVLLGTGYDVIDEEGRHIETFVALPDPDDVYNEFFVRNPFGHGTVMFRRSAIDDVGFYDETPKSIEDYELWWRMTKSQRAANLPESLYLWRVVSKSMSHGQSEERQNPIKDLVAHIWKSQPTHSSSKLIKRRLDSYRHNLNHRLAILAADQYIHNQYALGLALIAHGSRQAGFKQIGAMAMVSPRSLRFLFDEYYLNRAMRGYNLSLMLKPLNLVSRKLASAWRRMKLQEAI